MCKIVKQSSKEELEKSFAKHDLNKNNMIDINELAIILIEHLKLVIKPEDFPHFREEKRQIYEQMIAKAELIFGSGVINGALAQKDFVKSASAVLKITEAEAEKVFKWIDVDKKEKVNLKEIVSGLVSWME